ncbi:MAG: phage head-tail connector protein [Bacillota bacterium]|nr:phage head-tail connector protein [Bacillota bacterium]
MDPERLVNLRLLLLGDKTESGKDDLISLIVGYAEARLRLLLSQVRVRYGLSALPPGAAIPSDLSWIVDEVTARRFNRIGSEGMSSEAVDGHSMAFAVSDFDDFLPDLNAYVATQEGADHAGKYGRVVIY